MFLLNIELNSSVIDLLLNTRQAGIHLWYIVHVRGSQWGSGFYG